MSFSIITKFFIKNVVTKVLMRNTVITKMFINNVVTKILVRNIVITKIFVFSRNSKKQHE